MNKTAQIVCRLSSRPVIFSANVHTVSDHNVKMHQEKHSTTRKMEQWLTEMGPGGSVSLTACPRDEQIGIIKFNNPGKKNALTGKMMSEFRGAVRDLSRKQLKAVLLRGEGGTFCSGGDLDFVEKIASEEGAFVMNSVMMKALKKLITGDRMSVAVLEGHTMGGGTEIASACDIRVAKRDAKVGFVQGKMGVCPGWGGGRYLVETLGRAKAIEYLGTAAIVSAEELHRIGYVSHVFDTEDQLQSWIEKVNNIDYTAFVAAKRMVNTYTTGLDYEEEEQKERKIFMSVWGQSHHLDSISAIRKGLAARKNHDKKWHKTH